MTVLKEGAAFAELGSLMGFTTLAFTLTMTAWILWAWWPSRKEQLDQAARLPLED